MWPGQFSKKGRSEQRQRQTDNWLDNPDGACQSAFAINFLNAHFENNFFLFGGFRDISLGWHVVFG